MRRSRAAVLALGVAVGGLVLAACAPGANDVASTGTQELAGFWLGLWHGIITPVTFVISLFNDNMNIYEVHNNGNWYNFGFVFGSEHRVRQRIQGGRVREAAGAVLPLALRATGPPWRPQAHPAGAVVIDPMTCHSERSWKTRCCLSNCRRWVRSRVTLANPCSAPASRCSPRISSGLQPLIRSAPRSS